MQLGLTANVSESTGERRVPRAALCAVGLVAASGLTFLATTDTIGPAHGLVDSLARVGFWALILVAAARIGAWVVRSREAGLAHLAWDGAAGLGLLIACWLGVGLLPGGFRPVTIVAVFSIFGVLALFRARHDSVARFDGLLNASASATWVTACVALLIAAGLVWNRVPVLFFDTLAYHYAQPELWLLNGRIAAESWSLHSWFPPGMSVLYGVGLALGGEKWANDANLLLGVVLMLLAFDFARRLWGGAGGLLAFALLLVLPQIPYALAIPGADLGHGMFSAATLAALYLGRNDANSSWFRRAAWLAAGAVLTKYLGFMIPLGFGATWVFLTWRSAPTGGGMRSGLTNSLRWVVPGLLLVSPWLVANTITVGNPIAPILGNTFQPIGLADGGANRFQQDARGGLPGSADLRLLGPGLVSGIRDGAKFYPAPAWGWTVVALLPVFLIALRRDRDVRLLFALAFLLFLAWFMTYRWERFLVATTFLIAVAAAGSIVVVWKRGGAARGLPVAASVVAVLSLVYAGQEIAMFTGGTRVAMGQESPRAFMQFSYPASRVYSEAANKLDRESSHVLMLGEMRHFRLPLRRAAPTGFNIHPLAESLSRTRDSAQSSRELRKLGYTHLIVDLGWVERSASSYPSLALFHDRPDLLTSYLTSLGPPLHHRGRVGLFGIPER
jgi:hypothetical protein